LQAGIPWEERIGTHPEQKDPTASLEQASRYEPLDVPSLLPFWLGCILAAFVGVVLVMVGLGYPQATHAEYRGPLKALPPEPRLQSAPRRDLERYQAAKRLELRGSRGAVSIDVAMRETAAHGWGPLR
jgi:hypothetical protein